MCIFVGTLHSFNFILGDQVAEFYQANEAMALKMKISGIGLTWVECIKCMH